jgi:glycerate 2-kinase
MTAAFGVSGPRSLRDDAIDIWSAGVAAVDSARLVQSSVQVRGETLSICDHEFSLSRVRRICVVGGGKAGAGMAAGFEAALGDELVDRLVTGWVNVPADCVRTLRRVVLHAARPAGVNEPTAAGVMGADRMLSMVGELEPGDLCVVLLSGGGSALLPAPSEGISLADKQAVTRFLSRAGASIQELNCVRKQLSRIKGGGLAAACRAGTLIALIISDVIGDPLDVIASGPTVPNTQARDEARAVLHWFDPHGRHVPAAILQHLDRPEDRQRASSGALVFNHVIGSNRVALEAAAVRARALGYALEPVEFDRDGVARDEGTALAEWCRRLQASLRSGDRPRCVLSGGEPVVRIQPLNRPQQGGRNQELALAALSHLWGDGLERICILSGGTDGEDGPTDAAGAVVDTDVAVRARELGLAPEPFLSDHNAYPFFEATGGLLKTGPTQTNVMDVRVALVVPTAVQSRFV